MHRRQLLAVFVISAVCSLALGCMPAKAVGREVIDAALAVCAVENADKAPEEVAVICGVSDVLLPIIRNLLGAAKRGAVKLGAPPPKLP